MSMFDTPTPPSPTTVQSVQAAKTYQRIMTTLGQLSDTGASGVTRAKKDIEGCTWSLWTMERLGQLMQCTPDVVYISDVNQSSPSNVVFPEVSKDGRM
jgi:hypothetical protein